jgi:hypothetical protein
MAFRLALACRRSGSDDDSAEAVGGSRSLGLAAAHSQMLAQPGPYCFFVQRALG